jgi:two-component system OmpR family sensor kinase
VSVDPDLLAAALLNLLDNSVRYGATQVRCSFILDKAGHRTLIRLVDNGPGIDDAARMRIALALASQRYEQEMGLGLMLADRVARAHGGQLTLLRCESGFGVELSLASP